MSNLTEEEYNQLKVEELEELNNWFDEQDSFEESWYKNPMRILLEKQIEEIGMDIHNSIKNWPEYE